MSARQKFSPAGPGGYASPSAIAGAAASAGLSSSEGQFAQGGLGPSSSIALLFPAFTPAVTGQLLITGWMHVVNATPGQATTFELLVNTAAVAISNADADAAGNAFCSFSVLVPATTGVAQAIELTATALSNLTSAAKHQALNVVNIP